MKIKFAFLSDDEEYKQLPKRKNPTDAGIDLYPFCKYTILPGEITIVKTNLTVEIPEGFFGLIANKSRSDFLVGGGIVDQGYQGELLVKVMNVSKFPVYLETWTAVAQLLIIPCITPEIEIVDRKKIHVKDTARGASGGIAAQIYLDKNIAPFEEAYYVGDGISETMYEEYAEAMDLDDYMEDVHRGNDG